MPAPHEQGDDPWPTEEAVELEQGTTNAEHGVAPPRAVITRRISREKLNEPLRAHPYWKERE